MARYCISKQAFRRPELPLLNPPATLVSRQTGHAYGNARARVAMPLKPVCDRLCGWLCVPRGVNAMLCALRAVE